jgi:serine/threonine protein phosphatase PrpC/serine/threonine protein kinase
MKLRWWLFWGTSFLILLQGGFVLASSWQFSSTAVSMWEQANMMLRKVTGGVTHGTIIKQEYVLERKIQALQERVPRSLPSPTRPFFNQFYELREKFNRGAHGELWRTTSLRHKMEDFVAKRIFIEKSEALRLSGLREIYFGKRLKNRENIARYIEHFTLPRSTSKISKSESHLEDLWIIFRDEGLSLRSYLYETRHMITTPSPFWRRMRLQHDGEKVLREIIKQLLTAIQGCHSMNIAHRDIKPGNLIINSKEFPPKLRLADFGSAVVELEMSPGYSTGFLYDETGPSQEDETGEYMPPEVKLSNTLPYARYGTRNAIAGAKQYDMWSIGVVWLEILLANKAPFEISDKAKKIIEHRLSRQGIHDRKDVERAFFLQGLAEWGIFNPTHMKVVPISSTLTQSGRASSAIVSTVSRKRIDRETRSLWGAKRQNALVNSQQLAMGSSVIAEETSNALTMIVNAIEESPLAPLTIREKDNREDLKTCSDRETNIPNEGAAHQEPVDENPAFTTFRNKLKEKDPLNRGMKDFLDASNAWGVKLLWRLLQMRPDDRVSAPEALRHVYFRDEDSLYKCHATGKVYEFPRKLSKYCPNNSRGGESNPGQSSPQPLPHAYKCPTCGRIFDSWASCNTHMHGRRHHISKAVATTSGGDKLQRQRSPRRSLFCQYDSSRLPSCEVQPGFGLRHHHLWHNGEIGTFDACGLQGRRKYMEDYFSIDSGTFASKAEKYEVIDMYGVFDGHLGKFVAKFLVSSFFVALKRSIGMTCYGEQDVLTVECVEKSLRRTFSFVDQLILDSLWEDNKSGSTGTVFLRVKGDNEDSLVVGSVGDSRAVLCCDSGGNPVQMSSDHKPNVPEEQSRIEANGGFVEKRGVWRVQGQLAISRSFGDKELKVKQYSISVPSIFNRTYKRSSDSEGYKFLILGTDGLWDVVSNADAVGIVWNSLRVFGPEGQNNRHEFCHNSSKSLAQEAYVRDSRDNIGVMVIALW